MTCGGLGYGACYIPCFLDEYRTPKRNPITLEVPWIVVAYIHTMAEKHRNTPRTMCFPIKCGFRLFLRDRLTLHRWTSVETLHYSAIMIFTWFSLLMSAFSLLISPRFLTKALHRLQNVLLPNTSRHEDETYSHRFGNKLETRYIFSDTKLDQWALTLSWKDGCFQAHLLVVFAREGTDAPPISSFPTQFMFRDLSVWSGLFPSRLWTFAPKVCLLIGFSFIKKKVSLVFGVSLRLVSLWATRSQRVLYPQR